MVDSLRIDPALPRAEDLARAGEALRTGGLAAFPTETFYALGADPRSGDGIAALLAAKGRKENAPILLLAEDIAQVEMVAVEVPRSLEALADRFWPGPLTVVLTARRGLAAALTAGTGTIGVRISGCAAARGLARALGYPVTGTSANVSGCPAARRSSEIDPRIVSRLAVVLDGGATPGGSPSTVVDIRGSRARLLRAGAIPFERVLSALSESRRGMV
jgi:L-threonylcarbamoyladenylate synthase